MTGIKDENVSTVEGTNLEGDLADDNVLLSLEVEEAVAVLLCLDVLESRLDTSLEDLDLLEVGEEELRFVPLDLTMLDWVSVEVIVKLDGLVGGSSVLVLS